MAATIYFAGSEEIDFISVGNLGNIITFNSSVGGSPTFRSSWVRAGLQLDFAINGDHFPDDPGFGHFAVSPAFTPISDFWFHAWVFFYRSTTAANYNLICFGSNDNVWRLSLQATGSFGQYRLVKRDAAGAQTTLATSGINAIAGNIGPFFVGLVQVDIHVEYGSRIQVFIGGSNTPIISYVGDARTDGETELNQFFLGRNDFGLPIIWSEVIVSNQNTRPMNLKSFPPDSVGVNQDWDGSVNDINEVVVDDNDFISTRVVNEVSEWVVPDDIPAGRWDVEAVWQTVRISGGLTGPQNFEFTTRPAGSGSDFFSSDILVSAALENYTYVWNQNPDTSSDWLTGDLGVGFNLGIKAIT